MLESIITGCDILSEGTPSLFGENGHTVNDDFFLSEIEKCSEYNILNLDNFVPNDLPDADVDLAEEEPSTETNPNVFLLDDNVDRFEALLQSEFEKREMGKPHKTRFTVIYCILIWRANIIYRECDTYFRIGE